MPKKTPENLYENLGVSKNATIEEIRQAYIKIRKDAGANPQGDKLKEIQEAGHAWDILGDPQKRKEYDQEISGRSSYQEGPRWGGIQPDINDILGGYFHSSMGMSWNSFFSGQPDKNELYMTEGELGLLNALVDSYKKPRDGSWLVKDREPGSYLYELRISNGKSRIITSFNFDKAEMDKYWRTLDSLAYKIAIVPAGKNIDIGQEYTRINEHSLRKWRNGDKSVAAWPLKQLLADLSKHSTLVEFRSTSAEGNFKSKER